MSVFNSLGSNYISSFVKKSLLGRSSRQADEQLKEILKQCYDGTVLLTYKGRQALEIGLRRADLPAGSEVGINGFTCYVVYQAVERAGLTPVFIDTAPDTLNFGLEELKAAHQNHPNLRAVIVQNTLGMPAAMEAIEVYCKQKELLIIEDLAHSLGVHYADGREAGTVGSLVMLSFSQDKAADVVAGGVLVDRLTKQADLTLPLVSSWQRLINRFYPFWTQMIRRTYSIGLGRIIHAILKMLHLLATPMSDNIQEPHAMSPKAATLLLGRWPERETEAEHRKQISAIYQASLSQLMYKDDTNEGIYLRFPIHVTNRAALVSHLRSAGIYIGDTWYDAPIGPKKYLAKTSYTEGLCPNAEDVADHIVNLPTHINVSVGQAKQIVNEVLTWQKSSPNQ